MVKMNIFYKIRKKPKNVPQKTFFSKIAKQRRLELKICTILYAYSLHPAWGKLLFPQHLPGSSNGVLSKKRGIYIRTYCLLSTFSAVLINLCQIAFQPPTPPPPKFSPKFVPINVEYLLVGVLLRCNLPFFFSTRFFLNQFQVFVPTDVEYLLVVVLVRCRLL